MDEIHVGMMLSDNVVKAILSKQDFANGGGWADGVYLRAENALREPMWRYWTVREIRNRKPTWAQP